MEMERPSPEAQFLGKTDAEAILEAEKAETIEAAELKAKTDEAERRFFNTTETLDETEKRMNDANNDENISDKKTEEVQKAA